MNLYKKLQNYDEKCSGKQEFLIYLPNNKHSNFVELFVISQDIRGDRNVVKNRYS